MYSIRKYKPSPDMPAMWFCHIREMSEDNHPVILWTRRFLEGTSLETGSSEAALVVLRDEICSAKYDIITSGGMHFFPTGDDPFSTENLKLTLAAMSLCIQNGIPVVVLTQETDWVTSGSPYATEAFRLFSANRNMIAFGFEFSYEGDRATRIRQASAMRKLHESGFRTSTTPAFRREHVNALVDQTK